LGKFGRLARNPQLPITNLLNNQIGGGAICLARKKTGGISAAQPLEGGKD
jgi:hypothetical protein